MNIERRFFVSEIELRKAPTGERIIDGYAAIFNTLSNDLGGFREQIAPGAFSKTVREADVRALLNHDRNFVLARTRSGTLKLSEDATGLYYEALLPNTSYANDLAISVERGDINQSSFAFSVVGRNGESWNMNEGSMPVRTLHEVRLYDVSPVTVPAYDATTVSLTERSLVGLCEARGIDPAAVTRLETPDAIRALLEGNQELLSEPVSEQPQPEPAPEPPAQPDLALLRARLELTKPRAS